MLLDHSFSGVLNTSMGDDFYIYIYVYHETRYWDPNAAGFRAGLLANDGEPSTADFGMPRAMPFLQDRMYGKWDK